MFKRIKALFVKKKAAKMKKDAKTVYVMGHILLILSNNLKAMKTVNEAQKNELYNLYVTTLYGMMTDEDKLLFSKALSDTNEALTKLQQGESSNQVQIQRQLQEIFKTNNG